METKGGETALGAVLEGRYRVETPLARGGMSSVYRGTDLRLDRPVAIKIMEPRFASDRSFVDRFELEARAAARLDHPGVVAVHDQGIDGDHVYLVMELVVGGTLRDLLRQPGGLSIAVALSVLEPVLSALAAAHHAGLVHRDVKPENVLIGKGGAVKVGDFGLVRAVASASTTSDNLILGTVAYLSPEQVTAGFADARSDVYAAGVTLYEMLTGRPPYVGDTPLSVAYRHVNDDVPPPSEAVPGIPAALDDLVLRTTRRDPAARPVDAAAFLTDLERVRDQLGLTRVPVPVPEHHRIPADPDAVPTSDTEDLCAGIAALSGEGSGPIPAADRTVRTAPARPGPIGPQGTRAISPAELGVLSVGMNAGVHQAAPPFPPPSGPPQRRADGYRIQRSRGRRAAMIWVAVVLVLAAVVGGGAWWLGSGRWTTVPSLANLDATAAEQALRAADLNPRISQAHDNTVPAGHVVNSNPGTGARELRGSDVTVVVSEGKPVVPNVLAGASVQAAEQEVAAADLRPRLDSTADAYDSTVPSGTVLRLLPAAGTQLEVGSFVTVVLSKGPAPTPVPSVVGLSHDQAFAALRAAGFQPFDEPAQFAGQVAAGTVIRTDPPAGTSIAAGGSHRVGVVVSDAVPVPSLTGANVAAATQALQQLGLQLQVQQLIANANGTIIGQSPAAGTLVAPGTAITVSAFP